MFLILIEIIELKFCGLNKNFKLNIYKRSLSELPGSLIEEDEEEDKYEIENNYIVDFNNDKKKFDNNKNNKKIELKNSIDINI